MISSREINILVKCLIWISKIFLSNPSLLILITKKDNEYFTGKSTDKNNKGKILLIYVFGGSFSKSFKDLGFHRIFSLERFHYFWKNYYVLFFFFIN